MKEADVSVTKQFLPACESCDAERLHNLGPGGICVECGADWEQEEVFVARMPSDPEKSIMELAVLNWLVREAERKHLWGVRVFVLYHGERVGGTRRVAKVAQKRWPEAGLHWSREWVRMLLPEGEKALQKALGSDLAAAPADIRRGPFFTGSGGLSDRRQRHVRGPPCLIGSVSSPRRTIE